jgi:hypothetical protein
MKILYIAIMGLAISLSAKPIVTKCVASTECEDGSRVSCVVNSSDKIVCQYFIMPHLWVICEGADVNGRYVKIVEKCPR